MCMNTLIPISLTFRSDCTRIKEIQIRLPAVRGGQNTEIQADEIRNAEKVLANCVVTQRSSLLMEVSLYL